MRFLSINGLRCPLAWTPQNDFNQPQDDWAASGCGPMVLWCRVSLVCQHTSEASSHTHTATCSHTPLQEHVGHTRNGETGGRGGGGIIAYEYDLTPI